MQTTAFFKKCAVFLILWIATTNVWSFGGDSVRRETCVEPKFKNLKPPKLIVPGGEFSFTVSSDADPNSIKAVIKGKEVELDIKDDYGFKVKGHMPAEVTEGYALIKISAKRRHTKYCIGDDAWLVKISE